MTRANLPAAALPTPQNPTSEPIGTPQPQDLLPASMPPELEAFLAATAQFNPSIERQEFTDNKELWHLYLNLYELDFRSLKHLVEKHNDNEDKDRYKARQALACCYNLVPIVVRMVTSYVFSEAPTIDVQEDDDLEAFAKNCDGNGTSLAEFVKQTALPMAQVLGFVDVMVQNPLVTVDQIKSAADADNDESRPTVYPIYPQQRVNWSSRPNHAYNWLCFLEEGNEDANPLARNRKPLESWITLSAAVPGVDDDHGFWLRSWRPWTVTGSGTPAAPPPPVSAGTKAGGQGFNHEGDFCPTCRVPVSTLYWQKSCDPKKRHFGISKISMIAVLTKSIINILSWTTEDVLANLALLGLPTKGGKVPKDDDGNPKLTTLNAFSYLCYDADAKNPPGFVQGDTSHIEIKLKLITMHVQEILRLANLLGASAEAERISSGVQGVVMRNELFRELKDAATSLDGFTLELLALAKSWATGEDWTSERLADEGKVAVRYFKGPYATEPLAEVIKSAAAAIEMLREVSPTAAQYAYETTVRGIIPADNPSLAEALEEVDENVGGVLAAQSFAVQAGQAAQAGAGAGAGGEGSTTAPALDKVQKDADAVETGLRNDLRAEKTDYGSNAA